MAISEGEIRTEALKALDQSRNGRMTTAELIVELEARMNPVGQDAKILDGRSDTYFSQKVRNLVSHRNQGTGLVARKLADYDEPTESWSITAAGRKEAKKP